MGAGLDPSKNPPKGLKKPYFSIFQGLLIVGGCLKVGVVAENLKGLRIDGGLLIEGGCLEMGGFR